VESVAPLEVVWGSHNTVTHTFTMPLIDQHVKPVITKAPAAVDGRVLASGRGAGRRPLGLHSCPVTRFAQLSVGAFVHRVGP
jgi:hypothetical protein